MLRKRINKYNLPLREDPTPIEQRENLTKEILRDSTFFPKTVGYKDIDECFLKWVENELRVVFEGETLPTYALFSNQRFSEYMQMWDGVDEDRNLKMNFKLVARDNNPKDKTMYAKAGNVPIKSKYLMERKEIINDGGKKCYLEYRISQPVTVDLLYRITLITNKYELINEFNTLVHSKFRSIQAYIFPNGHAMPMKLNNVSDESDYTVEDRQYFAQTFEINLSGYILSEDDFEEKLVPIMNVSCLNIDGNHKKKADVEIEEFDPCQEVTESDYYNQPVRITMSFDKCDADRREFEIDCKVLLTKLETENVRTYKITVNDDLVEFSDEGVLLNNGDIVNVKITRINKLKPCKVVFYGENPDIVYDKKNDIPESVLDETNISQEIEVV